MSRRYKSSPMFKTATFNFTTEIDIPGKIVKKKDMISVPSPSDLLPS
jgi:hypothetical protein